MSLHLGVDIGGTSTVAVLTDADGHVLCEVARPTRRGKEGVVHGTVGTVAVLVEAAGTDMGSLLSIGVGVPGRVHEGVVRDGLNLDIDRLDLAGALQDEWGRRPVVDNDVNAAALGAWTTSGNGCSSLALLNLGTGLGAGLVLDGRVWPGGRGAAGEIGHVSIDPLGPVGRGKPPGSLEMYASGSGIAEQAGGEAPADVLARAGTDAESRAIRDGLFLGVASAVRLLVLTLDVDVVALGGGLTRLGQPLLDGVGDVVAAWRRQSPLLDELDVLGRVHLLDPDVPVAAIGAAMRGAGRG